MQDYSTLEAFEGNETTLMAILQRAARGPISEWSAIVIWNEDIAKERILLIMVAGKETLDGFPTGGTIVEQDDVDAALHVLATHPYFESIDKATAGFCMHQIPMPYVLDLDQDETGATIVLGEMRTVTVLHR